MTVEDVVDALTRIRVEAERFMDERDSAGLGWSEESVTDIAVHKGLPEVRVVQFNRRQEGGGVGADYLWWWLDADTAECFGMLVQAKRLMQNGQRWTVDLRHNDGHQFGELLRTADYLDVPAMFSVYAGGKVFRAKLPCRHGDPPHCQRCERMAVLIIGAYQVWNGWESPVDTATEVLNSGIPLEDLLDPALPAGTVWDVNLHDMGPGELRPFLLDNQTGPREIAKRIFAAVVKQRTMSFSAALAEPMSLVGEPIFSDVPQGRGHYPGPYFEHFLRGLRHSAPDYVQHLLDGEAVPDDIASRVNGIVLVQL